MSAGGDYEKAAEALRALAERLAGPLSDEQEEVLAEHVEELRDRLAVKAEHRDLGNDTDARGDM